MDILISVLTKGVQKIVKASQDLPLVESLVKAKLDIGNSCGGNGICGTCRIVVISGGEYLDKPNEIEQEMIDTRQFSKQERLSCQIHPVEKLTIEIPT